MESQDRCMPPEKERARGRAASGSVLLKVLIAASALAAVVAVVMLLTSRGSSEDTEVASTASDELADARRVAMDAAIDRTALLHLGGVKHFAVRAWPYVLLVEDLGSDRANERCARFYRDRVVAFYDYVRKAYPRVAGKEPESPLRIIVLRDRASFDKFNVANGLGSAGGGSLPNVVSYYDKNAKLACIYEESSGETDPCTIVQLCTYQLLDFLRPEHRYNESRWFDDGLAEFHAGVEVRASDDGGVTFEFGRVNDVRLNQMAIALRANRYLPLPMLFQCRTDGEADASCRRLFGGGGSRGKHLLHDQGWSFIYFCMNGPNPTHRESILRYLDQDVGQGEGDYNILSQSFGISDHAQWDAIQCEWEAYLRHLVREREAKRASESSDAR